MSRPPEAALSLAARVRRWRVEQGAVAPRALGVTAVEPLGALCPFEPGDAVWFVPRRLDDRATPWGLVALLPEPEAVRGALLVVAPSGPRDGFFGRLLGSEPPLPRGVRGAALLLKGYTAIGGGVDPASGLDLVWGEA